MSVYRSQYFWLCLVSGTQTSTVSLCLSVSVSICLSLCLSICLSTCLYVYMSVYRSQYFWLCLVSGTQTSTVSLCLSVCLSICLSVYISVCLSVYMSIDPSNSGTTWYLVLKLLRCWDVHIAAVWSGLSVLIDYISHTSTQIFCFCNICNNSKSISNCTCNSCINDTICSPGLEKNCDLKNCKNLI